MNPTLAQLILQDRKVAYAITDQNLTVVEVGGARRSCTRLDRPGWAAPC